MYWWIVELPDDDFGMVQADDEDIARDVATEEYGDKWLYIHRYGDIQNDMSSI